MIEIGHGVAYTAVALVLLTGTGNWACRRLFALTGLTGLSGPTGASAATGAKGVPAGWIIGWLERLLLAIGILTHSWEVIAAVVALKTVARFRELDNREFAEYFLVGSLFSVLWALLITSAWILYDRQLGIGLHETILGLLGARP